MSFFVTVPAIVLWLIFWRDVVTRSERWTLQGCFTMILWWTPYLYDVRGAHSPRSLGLHSGIFRCACFFFFFSKPSQRLSLQMLHCVVSGYTLRIVTFEGILSTSVGAHLELCWVFLVVIMSQWWSLLYSYCMLWWASYHQDLAFVDKWFGMVEAIHVCFCDGASHRRLCWKQLTYDTVHFRDGTHTTPRIFGGHLHTSLVDMEFLFAKGASDDHCDICRVWSCDIPLAFTLVRRFLRILVLHVGILFSGLDCVEQSFVLLLHCVVFGEHHTTMMCARRALSEAWNHMMVVLPFRCLRRRPCHDECSVCTVWLCCTLGPPVKNTWFCT